MLMTTMTSTHLTSPQLEVVSSSAAVVACRRGEPGEYEVVRKLDGVAAQAARAGQTLYEFAYDELIEKGSIFNQPLDALEDSFDTYRAPDPCPGCLFSSLFTLAQYILYGIVQGRRCSTRRHALASAMPAPTSPASWTHAVSPHPRPIDTHDICCSSLHCPHQRIDPREGGHLQRSQRRVGASCRHHLSADALRAGPRDLRLRRDPSLGVRGEEADERQLRPLPPPRQRRCPGDPSCPLKVSAPLAHSYPRAVQVGLKADLNVLDFENLRLCV